MRFEGLPLLHGHTHQKDISRDDGTKPLPFYQFSVGLDAWGQKPVKLEEVVQVLRRFF